jgi:molybdopterin-dependent oxidoreductase alpha subunit
MAKLKTPGGTQSIHYVARAAQSIGAKRLIETVRSKNTCKSCAFGTGGQRGGLHNESASRIEICKKNIQAHLADLQPAIPLSRFENTSLETLSTYTGQALEQLGRLTVPLYKRATDTHFSPIGYSKAIKLAAEAFKKARPERAFFYASGRSSNEAGFVMQLFARLFGTNHVNNCSYYCHQASGVGLQESIGTGTATVRYEDLHKADCIMVFGANPASNHPRFVKVLMKCRRRGGSVVVINPVKEYGLVKFSVPSDPRSLLSGGNDISSLYIQPNIGGDIALIKGIAKSLLQNNAIDEQFITQYTDGFDAFIKDIEKTGWDEIEQHAGIAKDSIEQVAQLYARSEKAILAWGMGLTQHQFGVGNIQYIVNLALLRGMIGKKGAGLLPLRGHSNIQGMGSMGVTPALKAKVFEQLSNNLSLNLPTVKGLDTLACLEAAHQGNMDLAFMLGGNLYGASPNANWTKAALDNIPLKIYLTPTLNAGHVNGTAGDLLIFPVRVRDEEQQATTQESMFNYIRMSDGQIERHPTLMSEVDIVVDIASQVVDKRSLDFSSFKQHKNIRQAIAAVIPGFDAMENMDETKAEFQIDGRTLYSPQFATANGKARFSVHPHQRTQGLPDNHFMMMTGRSEGQFNTIVFEEEDPYRGQTERWIVMMNATDMQRLNLTEGMLVTLRNATGRMSGVKVRAFDIRKGCILTYYPEANVLVPNTTDPQSRTPAFKSVLVEIVPEIAASGIG